MNARARNRKSESIPDPTEHYRRALSLWQAGQRGEAAAQLDAALRARPDFAEALAMGAYVLERGGKTDASLRFYRRALEIDPKAPVVWLNFGKLAFRLGLHDDALRAFETASTLAPGDADAANSRAGALRALGRLDEAERAAREALNGRRDFPEAALNLGTILLKLGRPEEALEAYRRARRTRADYADALCGEGLALRALNRIPQARAAFVAAEALGCREAINGRGCLDLSLGDFASGWEGYEARWIAGKSLAEALGARFPRWRGPASAARRVLVLNDHGLGDTLQFFRYLPMMARAGVEVTFVCPAKLHRLLSPASAARLVVMPSADETFDAQIALSSLPRAFGTRLESVPAPASYLAAEGERMDFWAHRIGDDGFKVGVVWQGNPDPEADTARSMPLIAFRPLAAIPGVRLISLQKGFGAEQLERLPPNMIVETLGPGFDAGADAFVDAAAAIAHLDLVVTCDTSVAHLAGALGAPVWLALKNDAEWRWLRERRDSPWYPSMRLFRQPRAGAWAATFDSMADALRARI